MTRRTIMLPCPWCHGDGFMQTEDRLVETCKEVCEYCHGGGQVDAKTGTSPETSAPPVPGSGLYGTRAVRSPED